MGKSVVQGWDGMERRRQGQERRGLADRRISSERRYDFRTTHSPSRRSLKAWVRSLTNARLGVDRRKGNDRRSDADRRSEELRSLLTPDEIADLLK